MLGRSPDNYASRSGPPAAPDSSTTVDSVALFSATPEGRLDVFAADLCAAPVIQQRCVQQSVLGKSCEGALAQSAGVSR